jgi:ubiquinol-cytochrome c reductase cytochrome b subunit
VLIPFIVPLTVILGGAALWPFFERWATGDRSWHHVNDRPRNAPVRTATGMAAVTFYGVLWAESANDVIADNLHLSLYTLTWAARVLIFAGPALAYVITKRVCLGLQRKDQEELRHGYETGIVRQLPGGEFTEVRKPVNEEKQAVLRAKKVPPLMLPPGSEDANGVPAPSSRGAMGRLRARANRAFAESIAAGTDGHDNGHRVGADRERASAGQIGETRRPAGAPSPAQLAPGDNQATATTGRSRSGPR